MLDEQPKTIYTPDFFTTQMGVEGGLTALYAQLRYLYGNAYYYNIMTAGTEEATYGASADGNFKSADLSGAEALLPNNANSQNLWGQAFTCINTATGTGQLDASHARPFNMAKFSEFYFIAAEAAVKGATGSKSARELINVLRARAGKWNYSVNWDKQVNADYSNELTAATPSTITIDYILDERMREYCGDGFRWFDLVRTQTWDKRAGKYTVCGANKVSEVLSESSCCRCGTSNFTKERGRPF